VHGTVWGCGVLTAKEAAVTSVIRVRRVYEGPEPGDGSRILVDRLWPRGLRKDAAALDDWLRDAAPSSELRTWYRHDPAKFAEFRRRYTAELGMPSSRAALGRLRALAAAGPLTLLTATADAKRSHAAVLAGLLASEAAAAGEAGDAACWAHLVCPDCGAVVSEGHREGCQASMPQSPAESGPRQ
jgi:uncharacterized protein YeaO (DUF488 family)